MTVELEDKPQTQTETKLKPFTCKRCHGVLAFVSAKVFKSGPLYIKMAEGTIEVRCEGCGCTRSWKPCDNL